MDTTLIDNQYDKSLDIEQLKIDRSSFESLVLKYQKSVFAFLIGMHIPYAQVEDLAQDIFITVFEKLDQYQPEKSQLITWIFTIARNKAVSYFRHKKIKDFFGFSNEGLSSSVELDLTQEIQQKENQVIVTTALQKLTLQYRTVCTLYFFNNLSLEEIATIEKCSLGTVKSRLFRGKNNLKKIIQELGYESAI